MKFLRSLALFAAAQWFMSWQRWGFIKCGLYGTGPYANDPTVNERTLQDLNAQISFALPAAGAAATGGPFDTAQVNPGRVPCVEMFISVPALPNLAAGETMTLQLQDSDDNVTFGNTADLPAFVITGGEGGGSAAFYQQFKAPIQIGRYIQLVATAAAESGNNTAVSATFGFIF